MKLGFQQPPVMCCLPFKSQSPSRPIQNRARKHGHDRESYGGGEMRSRGTDLQLQGWGRAEAPAPPLQVLCDGQPQPAPLPACQAWCGSCPADGGKSAWVLQQSYIFILSICKGLCCLCSCIHNIQSHGATFLTYVKRSVSLFP